MFWYPFAKCFATNASGLRKRRLEGPSQTLHAATERVLHPACWTESMQDRWDGELRRFASGLYSLATNS